MKMTLSLDPALIAALKHRAIEARTTASRLVAAAVARHLNLPPPATPGGRRPPGRKARAAPRRGRRTT